MCLLYHEQVFEREEISFRSYAVFGNMDKFSKLLTWFA